MIRALALAALLLLPVTAARAAETVIVLDGSGSMWGRVDGRTTIEIARDALAGLTRAMPPGSRLGLMAYGHRRAGDCADIETLIAPTTLDPARFAEAARRVTPRGRTPISAALRQAAQGGAGRIVLLSDGIETCVPDACADIRALRAQGVDVTVHVIGFDIAGAADRAALACIAEATGGRFVPARSAADLARALAELAGAPPAALREPAPSPAPPTVTETNLSLEAVEVEGGPRVAATWRLVALSDPPREVLRSPLTHVQARVPPGDYEVHVTAGVVRLSEQFRVDGAQQAHRVVLGMGTVTARALLAPGAAAAPGGWTVLADEVSGYRTGDQVLRSSLTSPSLRLPQGSYRMRWTGGAIERVEDFAVEAGGTVALDFDLQAGRVRVASDPGRPFPSWAVRRAEEERVLASVATTTGDFLLPAGDYVVMLRLEGRVAAERRVSVAAGQVQELRIPRP
jgi:Ca-activated chloride channel family protein